ncbi:MAG TPA: ATP-binding protein [Niallia sp.]|nr:ATP-binding protein [Niallia sp.]
MSIKTRIQTFTTLLLIVIMILVHFSIYYLFKNLLIHNELEDSVTKRNQTAEGIHSIINMETKEINRFLGAYLPTDGMIRIVSEEENQLLYTVTKESTYANLPVNYSDSEEETIVTYDDELFAVTKMPVIWYDGTIVMLELTDNINHIKETMTVLRLLLLTASILIIVPTFLAGRVLSKVILNPIQQLNDTMESIQEEGKFHHIPLEGTKKDELYKLKNTFNHMISILESQYEKQKQFVSDASHELKTPLTVIESYSNMLKRWGKNREDVLEESIDAIYSEAIHMKNMTNQLLDLARADGNWHLTMERINLVELCNEVTRKMEKIDNRIIFVTWEKEASMVIGDVLKLKQLLYILIDNGFKYGANQMKIHILTKPQGIIMEVSDNGVGISDEDIPFIFDRFYRVDKARTRDVGGIGLGLALAKEIMLAHHGEISITSELHVGSTFTCFFPYKEGEK